MYRGGEGPGRAAFGGALPAEGPHLDSRIVLSGEDDGLHTLGLVPVILDGHLRLSIRPQIGKDFVAADLTEAADELVSLDDRKGHHFLSPPAGVSEHDALISSALLVFPGLVHSHGYIGGLLVDGGDDTECLVIETVDGLGITDVMDDAAAELLEIAVALGGDVAGDRDEACRHQGLARYPAFWILRNQVVQYGVRDLVTDLIWMAFADRFRGEEMFSGFTHARPPPIILAINGYTISIAGDFQLSQQLNFRFLLCYFKKCGRLQRRARCQRYMPGCGFLSSFSLAWVLPPSRRSRDSPFPGRASLSSTGWRPSFRMTIRFPWSRLSWPIRRDRSTSSRVSQGWP